MLVEKVFVLKEGNKNKYLFELFGFRKKKKQLYYSVSECNIINTHLNNYSSMIDVCISMNHITSYLHEKLAQIIITKMILFDDYTERICKEAFL